MNKYSSIGGAASRTTQSGLDTKTILLVDNESAVLSSISTLLEARGCQVHTASSAAAATQVMSLNAAVIDCLVIGFSMPVTNGLRLLNRFRSVGWRHPTVLCSEHTMNLGDHPDAQYWPDYILAKPYCFDRLQAAISTALRTPD